MTLDEFEDGSGVGTDGWTVGLIVGVMHIHEGDNVGAGLTLEEFEDGSGVDDDGFTEGSSVGVMHIHEGD